jgi:TPR repeat protein
MKPGMMKLLMRRFFKRPTVYSDELHIRCMSKSTSQHVASKAFRQALDAKSKSVFNAVACGTQSFKVLWELILLRHSPTIKDLIWALLAGNRCGIPNNIDAAVHLTKMFPKDATPGACYKLSSEWDNSIPSDWPSVARACNEKEKCPQSLFYYYECLKSSDNTDSDDDEPASEETTRRNRLAVTCLTRAANLGLADAQYDLAEKLWWETRNYQKCHALVVKAAEQGLEVAIFLLEHSQFSESILPFPHH